MPITVSGFEHLAGQMLDLYEEAEQSMLGKMADHLSDDAGSPQWAARKQAEIFAVKRELNAVVADLKEGRNVLSDDFIKTAYNSSAQAFVAEASKFTDALGITELSPSSPKVASILSELSNVLDAEDRVILRKCNDVYADIIGRTSAKVLAGTINVRQAVQEELDAFANLGISGFVDKNGRTWEMSTYAEMATVTAIEKATLYGYIDSMIANGQDLAIISKHPGSCPLCMAWEDVVISVSGKTPGYPTLDEAIAAGCFHPRCLHNLAVYRPGITQGGRTQPRPVEPQTKSYTVRQRQRALERQVRKWKRRMAVATDPRSERVAYAYVRMYQQALRDLIKGYGKAGDKLMRKYWREGGTVRLSAEAKKMRPIHLKRQVGSRYLSRPQISLFTRLYFYPTSASSKAKQTLHE